MTYRVGNHQPQNLYRDDQYIGVMFSPIDAAAFVRTMNNREPVCDCESYEPCHGECCGVGMCTCSTTDEVALDLEPAPSAATIASVMAIVDAPYQPGLDVRPVDDEPHTPDVDHTRGAAEALAHIAERIANAADDFDTDALTTLRLILESTAAELGLDEEAPSSPRDAHTPFCDGTCRKHPIANCPAVPMEDVTEIVGDGGEGIRTYRESSVEDWDWHAPESPPSAPVSAQQPRTQGSPSIGGVEAISGWSHRGHEHPPGTPPHDHGHRETEPR